MRKILMLALILPIILLVACKKTDAETSSNEVETSKYEFVGKSVEPFEIKDLDGNTVTESIFKGQKLTMTVFWSPNCVPCIEELGAMDQLKEMESQLNFKLVTVCVEGQEKDIQDLKKNHKMAYPIIMLKDSEMMKECVKDFEFIPFVIYVDENGKYMKDFLVGSRTYEEYLAHLEKLLKAGPQ